MIAEQVVEKIDLNGPQPADLSYAAMIIKLPLSS